VRAQLDNYKNSFSHLIKLVFNARIFVWSGLLVQEGPHWSEQRRFCLKNLRDFGFGKKSMEGLILEDSKKLLKFLHDQNGLPINPQRRISIVVLSALWSILAGERLSHDDPLFQDVLDSLNT